MGSTQRPGVGKILAAHYLLVAPLGWDSWGEQFAAIHQRTGEHHDLWIALPHGEKTARAAYFKTPWGGDHFAAQYIRHPLVPGVHLLGFDEDNFILTRRALRERLLDRLAPTPPQQAATIVAAVASALVSCHERGLYHGAISPVTIHMAPAPPGCFSPKIVDFSWGYLRGEPVFDSRSQGLAMPMAQIAYLAPEIIAGKRASQPDASLLERAETYELALLLLTLILGRNPFSTENAMSTLVAAVQGVRGLPGACFEPLPPGLAALVRGALDPSPLERPALRRFIEGLAP